MPTIRSRKRWWLSLVIVVASLVGGLAWWNVTQPARLHLRAVLTQHTDSALYVEGFSPDGSLLVGLDLRRSGDEFVVWDVADGKVRKVIGPVKAESGDDDDVGSETPPRVAEDRRSTDFLGFSPDGTLMAIADNVEGINLWDTRSWLVRATIKAPSADKCHFFTDGRTLLVRCDRELQVWDIMTQKLVATLETLTHHTGGLEIRIAPDEKTLVAVVFHTGDGPGYHWHVDTWDASTWQRRQSVQWKDPAACDNGISLDGRLVAGIDGEGGFIRVWDVGSGRKLREMKLPDAQSPDREVFGFGWGQGGEKYLVWCPEGPLLLYDFEAREVRTLGDFETAICEDPFISWSRDGRRVAFLTYKSFPKNLWILGLPAILQRPTTSLFGTPGWWPYCSVRRFDVTTGRVQAEPWERRRLRSVALSPDDSILAVGDNAGKVHLFDVPKAPPPPE